MPRNFFESSYESNVTNAGSCAEQDFYVNFTYNKKNGSFSLEFQ